MRDINRKMAAGILWMSLMRLGIKGLGLISTIILARLLVPADFGLIAMAMSIIAGLELLRSFGFETVLIQRQDAARVHYDTAWTFNVLLAVTLMVLLLALAAPAADFYSEPRLRDVMYALSFAVMISGFENVGVVAFRKELEFRKEFALRIAQKVGSVLVTVPLAFVLRSYWALVIGMITSNVLLVLISYYAHPFRPHFSLAARQDLFGFSKWLFVNNILWFLRDRSPDFVLGRIAGPHVLGLFKLADEISNLPTSELVGPINRAVFPGYAKMAHDLATLRQGFLNVIGLIALVALPAGFGIAAVSSLLVPVLLGEKWLAAIPIVSLLAMFGALNALQTNAGSVHYAMGRPRTLTATGLMQVAALVPSIIVGASIDGAMGVAWAYLINVLAVILPVNFAFVLRRLQLAPRMLLASFWRPAAATALMYVVVSAFVDRITEPSLAAFALAVLIGMLTYPVAVLLLWLASGRPVGTEETVVRRLLPGSR